MKQLHLIVHGKVHGVFYRDFITREALKLGVKGWVKNLRDGTVEIVAKAEEFKLKDFLKQCRKGPLMAFVQNVEVKEEPPTGEFEDFNVHY